jgi:hypothetical protein
MRQPRSKPRSKLSRGILYSLLFLVYLVSSVPVGLMLYSMKSEVGLDVFSQGGFHAYMGCLRSSFPLAELTLPKSEAIESGNLQGTHLNGHAVRITGARSMPLRQSAISSL